ncbi:MAG: hypothetical protein ACRDGM_06230 [bacterium]
MIEEHTVLGRKFSVTIEGPDGDRRFNAYVKETASGRMLTRNPVRGRSVDDVRDRALEVMHNLLGIERIQEEVLAIAAEVAPGASVELTEDAHTIRASLTGSWELDVPFTVSRDEVEEGLDIESLRLRILEHFHSHLREP